MTEGWKMVSLCVKYLLLLLVVAYVSISASQAQRIVVDSLTKLNSFASINSKNASTLLELSEAYLTVNTDSALICGNAALVASKKLGDKNLEAGSYIAIGQSYDYVNQQIIALENFLQAKTIYTDIKNDSGLAITFYAMGEMYNTLRELQTSRYYFHKSLALFTSLKNETQIANLYGSLGNNFFRAGLFDSAQYYNKLGLAIGKKENDEYILQDILGNIADVLIEQKKLDEAEVYLKEANNYALLQGNHYGIAYGKNQLAKIALQRKDYTTAISLANGITAIGKDLNMDDLLMDAAEMKYKVFKQLKNADSSLLYLEKYNSLADTLTGKRKYLALDSLLNMYRFGKTQKEVELLKQTNKSNTIFLVSCLIALLLISGLLFSIYARSIERKKLTKALQLQAEKLQSLNHLKDRMFSIIGHDLRGPVSSLKGLVDFMKTNSLSNEDSEMVVKELKQSVNSVDMLLENLLVWAKMQMEGNIISKPEPLRIAKLVEEVAQLYYKPASLKNIELQYKVEESLTAVADSNYISLILRNLVNNAIKFTAHEGHVLIEATNLEDKIKLCVEDDGMGMSKDEIDKLFNLEKPFTKRGTMDEKGSGLGLLFVKEYTERCGGTFSITSEKGKGSRFCITLNKSIKLSL